MALLAAAPAHAIVGGTTIDVNEVPWFANIRGCGGTLVAPDRVVTAAHCVEGSAPQDRLSRIRIAGQTRKGVRFALHPDWSRDDVAMIQLDAPITNVAPVGLSAVPADQMFVVGRGASQINHRGAGALREATLRPVTDRDCGLFFRGVRGAPLQRGAAHLRGRRRRPAAALLPVLGRQRRPAVHRQPRRAPAGRDRQLRRALLRRRPAADGVRRDRPLRRVHHQPGAGLGAAGHGTRHRSPAERASAGG